MPCRSAPLSASAAPAGKVDASITADLRTAGMDVDAGEEARDDGLKVQVGARAQVNNS